MSVLSPSHLGGKDWYLSLGNWPKDTELLVSESENLLGLKPQFVD